MTRHEVYMAGWTAITKYEEAVKEHIYSKTDVVAEFTSNGTPILYGKFFSLVCYNNSFDSSRMKSINKVSIQNVKNLESNVNSDFLRIKRAFEELIKYREEEYDEPQEEE